MENGGGEVKDKILEKVDNVIERLCDLNCDRIK